MTSEARRWRAWDWVGLSVVLLVAGVLRVAGMTFPNTMYFDEYHYARQACFLVLDASACGFKDPRQPVHPPLGRWLIAGGIRAFGNNPLGWRAVPMMAGVVTVGLLYLLARKLFDSTAAAVIAAGLLALDALHFIHSRLAMLDVFVALFVVAASLFSLYDRDTIAAGGDHVHDSSWGALRHHRWRLAAGLAVGAAAASKWPGAFILPALVILTIGWELAARSSRGMKAAAVQVLREETLSIVVAFAAVPLLAYAATNAFTTHGSLLVWPWAESSWWRALVQEQSYLYRYHVALTHPHHFQTPPWLWFSPMRPVVYYVRFDSVGYRIVAGIGNPFAWWPALLALGYFAVRVLRDRRVGSADTFILAGFIATYGPWYLLTGERKPFQFYLLPAIPFMELALASVALAMSRRRIARVLVPFWAIFVLAFFISVYPWFTAAREPERWWVHFSPKTVDCETLNVVIPAPTRNQRSC